MKKVYTLLRYTKKEMNVAKELNLVNGCGGDGSAFDFDVILEDLEKCKNYKVAFLGTLKKDVQKLCNEHDLDYFLQIGFIKSNFIFCKNIYKLVKSWTKFRERFYIAFILFLLLNIFGKEYYKKAKIKNKELLQQFKNLI